MASESLFSGHKVLDIAKDPVRMASAPSVHNWRAVQIVLILLSVTAGSVDAIGFLGLGGLFIAHITGNLVILATHIAARDEARLANIVSFPLFIVALAVTRLLAAGLERIHVTSLRPLLLLEFLLLAGFLALCVGGGSRLDLNAANATVAAMLGISAMAVQNALVQISLKELPSTCVMTTNTTRFVIDLGEVLLGRSRNDGAKAGERATRTGLAIAGFVVGCGLGAGCQAVTGLWSVALPAGLALVALAIAVAAKLDGSQAQPAHPRLVQDYWEADPKETAGRGIPGQRRLSTARGRGELHMSASTLASATKAGRQGT